MTIGSNKKTRNNWLINQSQQHNYLNNAVKIQCLSSFASMARWDWARSMVPAEPMSLPRWLSSWNICPTWLSPLIDFSPKIPPWIEPEAGWIFMANLRLLVVFSHPSEKYANRQIESFPQVGVKITNIWNHHLVEVADFFSTSIIVVFFHGFFERVYS